MKTLLACIAATLSLSFSEYLLAASCQYQKGEARWSIKTSVPDGSDLSNPRVLDLQALIDLGNPQLSASQRQAIGEQRWSEAVSAGEVPLHEGDIVTVEGYLYRSRCQKDGDYHLEIGTSPVRQDASCFIVEIPDPEQISASELKSLIQGARDALESSYADSRRSHPHSLPPRIQVVGQFFLDETHSHPSDPGGGRGSLLDSGRHCASNVWEIHPVFRLQAAPAPVGQSTGSRARRVAYTAARSHPQVRYRAQIILE